jgi:hypothetical protein
MAITLHYRTQESQDPNHFRGIMRPSGVLELHVQMRVTDALPLKASVIYACARDRDSLPLPVGVFKLSRVGEGEFIVHGMRLTEADMKQDLHRINVPSSTGDLWVQLGLAASFSAGSFW